MQKRRPVIGITASWAPTQERPSLPDNEFDYLKCEYSESIASAGGIPIIIPNLAPEFRDAIDTIIRKIDGLLLSGGSDLAPELFGQEEMPSAQCTIRRKRDEMELEILSRWFKIRPHSPVLAICRGHQLLNVFFKGTLFQDLTACGLETIPEGHCTPAPERRRTSHDIAVKEGTLLAETIGAGAHKVNSSHHQGIDRLAKGLVVSAVAADGVIEAIEFKQRSSWLLSVQWHPEALTGDESSGKIFSAFVDACRNT